MQIEPEKAPSSAGSRQFVPKGHIALIESLAAGLLAGIGMPLLLWYDKGERNVSVILWFSIGTAAAAFLLLYLLFFLTRNAAIEVSDWGITVRKRTGKKKSLAWGEVASAVSNEGLNTWTIKGTGGQKVFFNDGGLTPGEWTEISGMIREHVREHTVKPGRR